MSLLAFPLGNPLPIRGEMFIGGTWVDITSRIRLANEIVISSRGRQNEQGRPGVCTCSFTLNNRDGYFSNRAPSSVNFGKLGKNTPFRVAVTEDRSAALINPDVEASRVRTVDKASLDIVGDLDVRIEYECEQWTNANSNPTGRGYLLAGKYRRTASANRSWLLSVNEFGSPIFQWTTDGTAATLNGVQSASTLPIQYGAIALRATIDVDNGAAGRTITFYTSDTIGGTWTQLGSPVVLAGTTSIFSGNADVELGRIDDGKRDGVNGVYGFGGRIYAFELRNGIAGTVVANAAITAQPRGTTTWSDGLAAPNTWLVDATASVTPDNYRFTGEMSSLPQQWDISGRDVFVPSQAADVTRRLSQGGVSVQSAWTRYWQGKIAEGFTGSGITAYWAMEDGALATRAANGVPRGAPATITNATFSTPSDLLATAGAITVTDVNTRIYGQTRRTGNGFPSFINFAMKMSSVPSGSTTVMDIPAFGDIGRCNISVTATGYVVSIYDPDGFFVASQSSLFGPFLPNVWNVYRLQFSQSGGTGKVDLGWYHPGDNTLYGLSTLTFTGLAGIILGFNIKGSSTGNIGTQFAQIAIGNYFLDNADTTYTKVASAFAGETTTDRWNRVLLENGVSGRIIGAVSGEVMGAQPRLDVMSILYEVGDAEQGVVYPDRGSSSLILRTRASLMNQYGPAVSYAAFELGAQVPLPTDDDQLLRNTVTASNPGGSSATSTETDGPNGTASPLATPPGAGVYTSPISRNVIDDRLDDMAAWDVFLGTWDEPRWPQVRVDFERSPYTGTAARNAKMHALSQLDVGDLVTLTALVQAGIPPDDARLFIQGMTETLGNRKWWIQWNSSPYGPWMANNLTSIAGYSRFRAAAAASTVTAGFTSTATGAAAFQITTAAGSQLWGTTAGKPGNFPLNVKIAGEVITLSGITGTTSPQTANVSARGVNNGGVGKAHLAGETVQVNEPFYPIL